MHKKSCSLTSPTLTPTIDENGSTDPESDGGELHAYLAGNGPDYDIEVTDDQVHTTEPVEQMRDQRQTVRADLGGHLKYSQRWSGVRAGVLLGAQGAVRRGENRGRL